MGDPRYLGLRGAEKGARQRGRGKGGAEKGARERGCGKGVRKRGRGEGAAEKGCGKEGRRGARERVFQRLFWAPKWGSRVLKWNQLSGRIYW